MDIVQEMLTTFNGNSDFHKKVITDPRGLFPFPKLKTPMKGKLFAPIEEIKEKSKQELLVIPKSAFQKCFEDWKKRWHKCSISEGGYFD